MYTKCFFDAFQIFSLNYYFGSFHCYSQTKIHKNIKNIWVMWNIWKLRMENTRENMWEYTQEKKSLKAQRNYGEIIYRGSILEQQITFLLYKFSSICCMMKSQGTSLLELHQFYLGAFHVTAEGIISCFAILDTFLQTIKIAVYLVEITKNRHSSFHIFCKFE